MKKIKIWIKLKDETTRTRRTTVRGFMSTFNHINNDMEWRMLIVYKKDDNVKLGAYYNYPNNTKHPISNNEINY